MANPHRLRRTAIAAGAAILVLVVISQAFGAAISDIGDRLSAANDPTRLKLATVVAAARGDAAAVRLIARLSTVAVADDDRTSIRAIGEAAIAYTDLVEPAARTVGVTITSPTPAPPWLIPCFRDVQAIVQQAGDVLVGWASDPQSSPAAANVEAAIGGLADLADLIDATASTGTTTDTPTPGASDLSHVGAHFTDPARACEQIQSMSAALSS